jgi:hypothetical protein
MTGNIRNPYRCFQFPQPIVYGVNRDAVSLTLYLACSYKVEIDGEKFPEIEKIFDRFSSVF